MPTHPSTIRLYLSQFLLLHLRILPFLIIFLFLLFLLFLLLLLLLLLLLKPLGLRFTLQREELIFDQISLLQHILVTVNRVLICRSVFNL
jgi:hypothetical protein